VILNAGNRSFLYIFFLFLFILCNFPPAFAGGNKDTPEAPVIQPLEPATSLNTGGLADEIRSLTETGILSSMLHAVELIRSRDLSATDFGRLMSGVNTVLIRRVYPDSLARLPAVDMPQTSNYTRILREAERGVYTRPPPDSNDFLELVLPFLAVNNHSDNNLWPIILWDLERAQQLQSASVLPPYFSGIILEYSGRYDEAVLAFNKAYSISNEFYPAQIGIARVDRLKGNPAAAAAILSNLAVVYPDSGEIRRELALCYYANHDWPRALPAIEEILRAEPRDGEFLLMRAHILIDQGHYSQANTSLDNYASINSNNRDYLYMRAQVQFDGSRNRDSALNYLRSILRTSPNDTQAMIFAVTLLMDSQREGDHAEGRELLERLRQAAGSLTEVMTLSLRDAVRRESWQEAQRYLNSVLAVRRTAEDLTDGYYIERGLGNNSRALTYARELYDRDNSNNDYTVIYISALIDNNQRTEASRLIESRLNSITNTQLKSRFFYLRSRLQTNSDDALGDLRSSLFEDPRNLDAIIAMFEIYHNRREERRAVYYLRQALAIAPDHPQLRRYEIEYASLLGRN
jgi:tetratricopeptide (TPR) repeat protein